jgi:hypothetical protein
LAGVFNLCQHFEISYSRYANKHYSLMACILWWNLNFSFKSYGKERLYIQILYECWRWAYPALVVKLFIVYYNTIVSWLSRINPWPGLVWFGLYNMVCELAKGFSIYSVTYEKSQTIWWIKSHNSGMKNWNFTKKYTDRNYAKFEVNWPVSSTYANMLLNFNRLILISLDCFLFLFF